jgi:hypothetical protein
MGKLIDFGFSGKIGGLIYSKVGDSTIIRSAPRKIKQTDGTKECSTEFGRASRTGKNLRMLLKPVILFPKDSEMHGRLVSTLLLWLRKSYEAGMPCIPLERRMNALSIPLQRRMNTVSIQYLYFIYAL